LRAQLWWVPCGPTWTWLTRARRAAAPAATRTSLAAPNVPSGEKFYLVEVSHRGRIVVQPEDARNGKVALSLGN